MPTRVRLLGFAFTNADFLFEVDGEGTILFAAGAAKDLVREDGQSLVGRPASRLFRPSEGVKFITFVQSLKSGKPRRSLPAGPGGRNGSQPRLISPSRKWRTRFLHPFESRRHAGSIARRCKNRPRLA